MCVYIWICIYMDMYINIRKIYLLLQPYMVIATIYIYILMIQFRIITSLTLPPLNYSHIQNVNWVHFFSIFLQIISIKHNLLHTEPPNFLKVKTRGISYPLCCIWHRFKFSGHSSSFSFDFSLICI